ncbi:hypothetical protein XENOCAPTIV_022746, partial [Xenoophorus captivus]
VCGVRGHFYLQLRLDIGRGALPCPAHLKAHLLALMLQGEDRRITINHCSMMPEQRETQIFMFFCLSQRTKGTNVRTTPLGTNWMFSSSAEQ